MWKVSVVGSQSCGPAGPRDILGLSPAIGAAGEAMNYHCVLQSMHGPIYARLADVGKGHCVLIKTHATNSLQHAGCELVCALNHRMCVLSVVCLDFVPSWWCAHRSPLQSRSVLLNGKVLSLVTSSKGQIRGTYTDSVPAPSLPSLAGQVVPQKGGGDVIIQLPPASYGFVRFAGANVAACQ